MFCNSKAMYVQRMSTGLLALAQFKEVAQMSAACIRFSFSLSNIWSCSRAKIKTTVSTSSKQRDHVRRKKKKKKKTYCPLKEINSWNPERITFPFRACLQRLGPRLIAPQNHNRISAALMFGRQKLPKRNYSSQPDSPSCQEGKSAA